MIKITHSYVIKKILSSEQQAKKILGEAEDKKASLDSDLEENIRKIRLASEQAAQREIKAFKDETDANLASEQKKLDNALSLSLEKFEKLRKSKENSWINNLTSVVIDNA